MVKQRASLQRGNNRVDIWHRRGRALTACILPTAKQSAVQGGSGGTGIALRWRSVPRKRLEYSYERVGGAETRKGDGNYV